MRKGPSLDERYFFFAALISFKDADGSESSGISSPTEILPLCWFDSRKLVSEPVWPSAELVLPSSRELSIDSTRLSKEEMNPPLVISP